MTAEFSIAPQDAIMVIIALPFSLQTPHYVRCLIPNYSKSPEEYDMELMTNQIRFLGLLENVRVRRSGYPYRITYDKFLFRLV